jgi:CHAT domain-containing protein
VPLIVEHELAVVPSASVIAARRARGSAPFAPDKVGAVLADPVFESRDPRFTGRPSAAVEVAALRSGPEPDSATTVALRSAGFVQNGVITLPRLIATRREAAAITRMAVPGTVLSALDFRANRSTALSADVAQYPIIHFATHGVLNNEAPELSGVVLSTIDERGRAQDGFLRLRDIYGLNLSADLVVLSACNTALGKPIRGEGLDGMVRGFLHAGARRVVASYWKVDDGATAALMERFYAEMLQNGRSPSAAMRAAQRSMLGTSRWRSPFYWAGFALYGDWQ